jgi:hypothetical protein
MNAIYRIVRLERIPVELNLSLYVMRGHSASQTRVNALVVHADQLRDTDRVGKIA